MARHAQFVALLLAISAPANSVHAELPPRSGEDLDANAKLIVIGTVTAVDVCGAKYRPDGREYAVDLAVQVTAVKKGDIKIGSTLIARGKYINLKSGYDGGGGHYFDANGRMVDIEPGWEMTFHLAELPDGSFAILSPNGLEVVTRTEKKSANWGLAIATAITFAVITLLLVLSRWRANRRVEVF